MKTNLITEISAEAYVEIKKAITQVESPHAFDPVQTHIIIIEKLSDIQRRLEIIETKMDITK